MAVNSYDNDTWVQAIALTSKFNHLNAGSHYKTTDRSLTLDVVMSLHFTGSWKTERAKRISNS